MEQPLSAGSHLFGTVLLLHLESCVPPVPSAFLSCRIHLLLFAWPHPPTLTMEQSWWGMFLMMLLVFNATVVSVFKFPLVGIIPVLHCQCIEAGIKPSSFCQLIIIILFFFLG